MMCPKGSQGALVSSGGGDKHTLTHFQTWQVPSPKSYHWGILLPSKGEILVSVGPELQSQGCLCAIRGCPQPGVGAAMSSCGLILTWPHMLFTEVGSGKNDLCLRVLLYSKRRGAPASSSGLLHPHKPSMLQGSGQD